MKKIRFFLVVGLALILSSCAPLFYHQVYNISSTNEGYNLNLEYSDANCTMTYNFWKEEGNAGFWLENKTDQELYVDLSKSFFVKNGVAYDYYRNRIMGTLEKQEVSYGESYAVKLFGLPVATGADLVQTQTSMQSSYYVEPKEICVPAHTRKYVKCPYPIYTDVFRDCNLLLYPQRERVWNKSTKEYEDIPPVTSDFVLQNSPVVFKNIISYHTEGSEEYIKAESTFFISRVCNYGENQAVGHATTETICGKSVTSYQEYMLLYAPDRFYNKYRYSVETYNGH